MTAQHNTKTHDDAADTASNITIGLRRHDMSSPGDSTALSKTAAGSMAHTPWFRWAQLVMGIACMALVANLQYGWTLFVNPIDAKYHWGRADIQIAFSIFVVV